MNYSENRLILVTIKCHPKRLGVKNISEVSKSILKSRFYIDLSYFGNEKIDDKIHNFRYITKEADWDISS